MERTGVFMDKTSVRFTWVDWLLLTAIVGLSAYLLVQLLEPAIEAWQHRPRPGMQVEQRCAVQVGSDASRVAMPVNYLLYLPPDYTNHTKWPLVVYLHGSGARGQDLNLVRQEGPAGLVEHDRKFRFILLSPQCPAKSSWLPDLVVGLIEHISSSLSVDQDRVYLTGYSRGGFGTWDTATYDPARFAAIAPLSGGGDVNQGERLVNVPIWAFHGAKDNVVPLKVSQAMVDVVKKCGGQVKFTVYPNEGHGICGLTYQNGQLYEWLLAQRRARLPQQIP